MLLLLCERFGVAVCFVYFGAGTKTYLVVHLFDLDLFMKRVIARWTFDFLKSEAAE